MSKKSKISKADQTTVVALEKMLGNTHLSPIEYASIEASIRKIKRGEGI